jgi:cytochrome c2
MGAFGRTLVAVVVLALSGCGGDQSQVSQGDPARGATVFATQGCGNCHTFAAAKSIRNVGPNLDQVVETYDADFIRTSLVDPQAYIEAGSGGLIGGEKLYQLKMPSFGPGAERAENQISDQDIEDLVAYLTTARTE